MHRIILLLSFFLLFSITKEVKSQSVTIGNGTYLYQPIYGPANISTDDSFYNRSVYLYPSSLFGSLQHGDTIRSIEFQRNGAGSINGGASMRILLKLTDSSNLGTNNINWLTESQKSDVVEVYNDNPSTALGSATGFVKLSFNQNFFEYDTNKGKNLQLFVEYYQTSTATGLFRWYGDISASVPAYQANQSKLLYGSKDTFGVMSTLSSDYHPQIKLNFPRFSKDLEVNSVFSLGKLPVPAGNIDSMKAIVRNAGKYKIDSILMYVRSQGANKLLDSFYIRNIDVNETRYIVFNGLSPDKLGLDTVSLIVSSDDNALNNIKSSYRLANENLYSYRNTNAQVAPGGIGFNGATGDFVAKFSSNTPKILNQVSVNFGALGRSYRMGIWAADGPNGTPGTILYMSDSLISADPFTVLPVFPPVNVNGNFYAGIRQLGTQNVAFGFQNENPVRLNTFLYTSPAGNTNWIDFAPLSPFRFMIEPRLQAKNDVAPIKIISPKEVSLYAHQIDTITPKVTILNYGVNDQNASFSTTYECYKDGVLIYRNSVLDTLSSGARRDISFYDSLYINQTGTYQVTVYTSLNSDDVVLNDTIRGTFQAIPYKEILVDSITEPRGIIDYKLRDTIAPKAWISHQGIQNNEVGFTAIFEIYAFSGSNLVYTSSIRDSIKPNESKMLTFDSTFYPIQLNEYITRVTIIPDTASRAFPDTFSSSFDVEKGLDVSPSFSFDPTIDGVYELNKDIIYTSVLVSNTSSQNANNFKCVYQLFDSERKTIWKDSTTLSIKAEESAFVDMPIIYCEEEGTFELFVYTALIGDEYPENDTLIVPFTVQKSNDVLPKTAILPSPGQIVQQSNTPFKPRIQVNNIGLADQDNFFFTTLKIYKDDLEIYSSRTSSQVKANDSVQFVFDWFTPKDKGYYSLMAITELTEDQLVINDTFRAKFTVDAPFDVVPLSFSMPEPDSTYEQSLDVLKPQITFTNSGFDDIPILFDVHFEAHSKGERFYKDTKQITLNSGESKQVAFDSTFIPTKAGAIQIYAISAYMDDYRVFNDTLIKTIYTEKKIDVSIDSLYVPNDVDSLLINTSSFLPQFVIKNEGIFNLPDNWNIQCIIKDPSNSTVYFENSTVSDLDSGLRKVTVFSKRFTPRLEGYHEITFISNLEDDQEPLNDTLRFKFYAALKYDADAVSMVYPSNGQTIDTDVSGVFVPTLEVAQHANYTIRDSVKVVMEIFSDGNMIYTDTVETSLNPLELKNITMNKSFSKEHKGAYQIIAFTKYGKDQVTANDSLSAIFNLDYPLSIKTVQTEKLSAYPNPIAKGQTLHFDYSGSLDLYKAKIYAVDGKLMAENLTLSDNSLRLPDHLNSAIYFVVLHKDNALIRTVIQIKE